MNCHERAFILDHRNSVWVPQLAFGLITSAGRTALRQRQGHHWRGPFSGEDGIRVLVALQYFDLSIEPVFKAAVAPDPPNPLHYKLLD